MKHLLPILTMLLLTACSPNNPSPNYNTQPTTALIEAILKLDTKGHTALIKDIITTKSGDIISASDDKTIRVWESKTGKEKRKILGEIGAGSQGAIYAIALTNNEKFLAVGGNLKNNYIRIYDYKTGKLIKNLESHNDVVYDLAFSNDGKYLISGSKDKTAKIWNIQNNFSLQSTIKFHTDSVHAVGFVKKDKKYFSITTGYDNVIILSDFRKDKIIKKVQNNFKLRYMAISNKNIAVCGVYNKEIQIYDFNLKLLKKISSKNDPWGLAYSPNKNFLVAGVGASRPTNVTIYDVTNDYKKKSSFTKHEDVVMAVAFLNNEIVVSGGGRNNTIYSWNINSKKNKYFNQLKKTFLTNEKVEIDKEIEGIGNIIDEVSFRGDEIAFYGTAEKGDYRKILNLKNMNIYSSNKKMFPSGLSRSRGSFNLKEKRGSKKYSSTILELTRNRIKLASIERESINGSGHNAYGFYKEYIISGGPNGVLKIYTFKGQEIATLVGHTGFVWSLALKGDKLISGSDDQTIRIWDLSTLKREMKPQLNLFISKKDDWIAWTPQGFYNASKGAEQYIGYHINQGANKEAKFLDISRFKKQFYRPDLIQKAINGEDLSSYAKNIDIDSLLKAGLPPQIKILTTSTTIHDETITLGVDVCDEGGSFDNLRFYVDDAPIKYLSQTKAFQRQKKVNGNCTLIEQSISVPSGTHTIGFNATNKEGNIISNTSTISITNTKKAERKPNLHVLTLSVADYKDDSLDLTYPNNDAKEVISKLQKIKNGVFDKVYPYSLKDSQVNYTNIQKKVKEIAKKVQGEDVFVLYVSGHGVTDDKSGNYYFIPYACPNSKSVNLEAQAISHDKLQRIMEEVGSSKSAVFLDTCESGGMVDKQGSLDASVQRFGGNIGRAIIAGATSKQNAIDGYKKHGIFTYTVLDAMDKTEHYGVDKELSVNDIAEYVKYMLPKIAKEKYGHAQKPTIYLNGDTTFSVGGL